MASAGIPGMVGFVAEFIVYRSSILVFPIPTLLCMIGTALTAVYFLNLINRVFFGRLSDPVSNLPAIYWKDRIPSIVILALVITLGLQPNWMMRWSERTSLALGSLATEHSITSLAPLMRDGLIEIFRTPSVMPAHLSPHLPTL